MKRSKTFKLLLGILLCVVLIPINSIFADDDYMPVVDLSATFTPNVDVAFNRADITPADPSLYDVRVTSVYDYDPNFGEITHDAPVLAGHTYDVTLQFTLKDSNSYISPLPHIMINGYDVPLDNVILASDSSTVEAIITVSIADKRYSLLIANGFAYRQGETNPILNAYAGETIYLVAQDETNFDYWEVVEGGAMLANDRLAATQFTMPENNVIVQAHNKTYGPELETVVDFKIDFNGREGLSLIKTEILSDWPEAYDVKLDSVYNHELDTYLSFDVPIEYGYTYDITVEITLKDDYIASANPHIIFNGADVSDYVMAGDFKSLKVTKSFRLPDPLREVLVANGKAFRDDLVDEITEAYPGQTIYIVALSSDEFDYWEVSEGSVSLENPNSFTTKFTMPNENVKIQAHNKQYHPEPEPEPKPEPKPEPTKPVVEVKNIETVKLMFVAPKTNENGNANEVKTADKMYKIIKAEMEPKWDVPYKAESEYTLVVSLKANEGYKFTPSSNFTINDQKAEVRKLTDNEVTIAYKFPKTEKATTEVVPETPEVIEKESNSMLYIILAIIVAIAIITAVLYAKKRNNK